MADDQELWKRISHGDADAFHAFYKQSAPRLRAFLQRLVGSPQAADDVTQNTFLHIWAKPEGFQPERGTLRAYLYGIGKKQAAAWWRKHKISGEALEDHPTSPHTEIHAAVSDAFHRLPAEQRQLLWLREVEGHSYADIAAALQIPIGTVRSRLFAAREALRTVWKSER